jgi:gliding motility-associated lipoprotein GldH
MNKVKLNILPLLFISLVMHSCTRTGVFEKNIPIPGQMWESSFQPTIDFDINDTTSTYRVYIVARHTNRYKYNNLWVKASVKEPGSKDWKSQQYDLLLANNDKGWLGTGMDDIFEHRILIQPETKFVKPGKYQYTIQQIMRDDPLSQVLNIGLRIEKVE